MAIGRLLRAVSCAAIIAASASAAHASDLITNGGFETGDFTGWNANVEQGSNGNLFVNGNGNASPDSGFATPTNPNGGAFYAITDQGGPGSYSLTQSFTLASAGTVHISFDLFTDNSAGVTFANGRDYNTSPNQNAEVDILKSGVDAFTNDPNDIAAVLYGPASSPGGPNPWQTLTSDLSLAAGTYTFRFAETDNDGFFQAGLDNVSVSGTSAAPEPASWAMMLGGFGLIGGAMRKRRAVTSLA